MVGSEVRAIHAVTDDAGRQRSTSEAGRQSPGTTVRADGVAGRGDAGKDSVARLAQECARSRQLPAEELL
ncbi:hypothetical protein CGL27_09935 [Streptomyces sp. 11-1-2]|nr:hypothetical protein CGL27_09935 [Streptomyces sp. 11-1-2]